MLAFVVVDSSITKLWKMQSENFVKQQAAIYPKTPLTINSKFFADVNP